MDVDVVDLPRDLTPAHLRGRAVAVVDALRATTTIARALHAGAERIKVYATVEEVRRQDRGGGDLWAGERNCVRVDGFDLGHSPRDLSAARERTVHMSTTNGTKSLIGHPQGAGGAAGVAAAVLCARRGVIHPTLNLADPDPACDLNYTPLVARGGDFGVILCNCIAFGSKNAAVVVRVM